MKKAGIKILYGLGVLFFWMAVWLVVSYKVNTFLFPTPRGCKTSAR